MQKLLRRTAMAKRQAKRKAEQFQQRVERVEAKQYKRELVSYESALRKNVREARKAWKLDWELGPLAPRRDYGEREGEYGAVDASAIFPPTKPVSMKQKDYLIRVGDRVVITNGLDEGKIGVVTELKEDAEYAFVDGLRVVRLRRVFRKEDFVTDML
jgi:large subunit ribosomal protein L24